MRKLLFVAVIGGLGVLFMRQHHTDHRDLHSVQTPATPPIAKVQPHAPERPLTAAADRTISWPKSSIDRARAVANDARQNTSDAQH